jgi:putative ABC transport system permease protein
MSRAPSPAAAPAPEREKSQSARGLVGPYALIYAYRARLRLQGGQELLAAIGVAVAVALVFATLVANSSVAGSAREVLHKVFGPADLQLQARSPEGFPEGLLGSVEHVPGVKQAAPALEENGRLIGAHGRQVTVTVVGSDLSLAVLNGLAHTVPISTLESSSIALTKESAQAVGIRSSGKGALEGPVSLALRGSASPLKVAAVLGPETVGPLSLALAGVMRLDELQRLSGLRGRVSRILVETEPGRERAVRSALQRLVAGRIAVTRADHDIAVLDQALAPSQLASDGFAVVAVLLGFLFAFNAVLLTAPERRRVIAEMRLAGATRGVVIEVVLFQAICLGLIASVLGALGGYLLSVTAFHQRPGYLSEAFTLGGGTVVGAKPLVLSVAGGVAATVLASMLLFLDLRRGRAIDAVYAEEGEPGNALSGRARRWLGGGAASLFLIATLAFLLAPSLALAATALLALATALAVPLTFAGVLRVGRSVSARADRLTSLPVAITSLEASPLRSIALMSTGAVALFGAVALGGARGDLLAGLDNGARAYSADAPVWIYNRGDTEQTSTFLLNSRLALIARLPGVVGVHIFQSGFLTLGDRRVAIFAHPSGTGQRLLASQIVEGNLAAAIRRLREGGWIALSKPIADERHVGVGGGLTLPTATGNARFRIAALITNFGWPGGAIFINSADYARFWATSAPTALGVDLAGGARAGQVQRQITAVLGPRSGLEAVSAHTWSQRFGALAAAGLDQLREISGLLLVAAILAMAGALASAIWQRRAWVAGLRLAGAEPSRLRRALLLEAALTLGAACVVGAIVGVYGETVLDSYFRHVTGFPVTSLSAGAQPLETCALALVATFLIATLPARLASNVSPALALQEE